MTVTKNYVAIFWRNDDYYEQKIEATDIKQAKKQAKEQAKKLGIELLCVEFINNKTRES